MREIPDVRVEFTAHWRSVASGLSVHVPAPWAEHFAASTAHPYMPWTVAFDGSDLQLTVGPVQLASVPMSHALATFDQLHASTGLAVTVDPSTGESTSVRLLIPDRLSLSVCETLREVLAEPLSQLLGEESLSRLEIRVDDDGVVLHLAQPLVPEVSDHVMPLLAGVGAVVALDAPDGSLPRGGAKPLLDTARALLTGAMSRSDLDIIGGPFGTTPASGVREGLVPKETGLPPAREFGPLRIIPFRSNARPIDEVEQPGSGCSQPLGVIGTGLTPDEATLWILFRLDESDEPDGDAPIDVRLSAAFVPAPGSPLPEPVSVPSLIGVAVPPQQVSATHYPRPVLEPARFTRGTQGAYVAAIDLQRDLLPDAQRSRWTWDAASPVLHAATPDGHDPFTFAHLFKQRLKVELALDVRGQPTAWRSSEVDVFDIDRFGTLYDRLIVQLVRSDTQAQAARKGLRRVYEAYHPWYPVLAIGVAKARLYMRAVREDVSWQRRNLADPGWLMRVGLYLEFLTCLGIIEVVKDEYPNLLTASERRCFEDSPAFEQIRQRIDTHAWGRVWDHRTILFASNPLTAAGPVDFRNLVQKEAANLAFLEAHHEDLKHAIELAGPNLETSQQTWHQVYRDAERAVLDASQAVFPEFRHLGGAYQHFVLWHEQGKFPTGMALLPPWLTAVFGDRDGVYPTAARRYRDSMNEVATWAKHRGLMDYVGEECVPLSASLIESQLEGEDERYSALQASDGYGPPLDAARQRLVSAAADGVDVVVSLLRTIEIFEPLTVSELWQLAHQVERRAVEAGEILVVQGQPASSLNIIEAGSVEVIVRQPDDTDLAVDRMGPGDIFGEYSLLTGQPTTATVRTLAHVIVHVIPKSALQPIIEARPELIVELSVVLGHRRINRRARSEDYLFGSSGPPNAGAMGRLVSRVRDFLLT